MIYELLLSHQYNKTYREVLLNIYKCKLIVIISRLFPRDINAYIQEAIWV